MIAVIVIFSTLLAASRLLSHIEVCRYNVTISKNPPLLKQQLSVCDMLQDDTNRSVDTPAVLGYSRVIWKELSS